MSELIELKNNEEAYNCLIKLKSTKGCSEAWLLRTLDPSVSICYRGQNKIIRPLGGPTIEEGKLLKEANRVVKRIYIQDNKYVIIFEEKQEEEE